MSTTRSGALVALALTVALTSCLNGDRPSTPNSLGGAGGNEDTGGSTATGGSTGGSPGTGGKATGGSTGTGGSSTGGSTGTGGAKADAGSMGGSSGADASSSAWPGCLEPVFSGVMPMDFCTVYGNVCTFTGTSHYTSMQDCMTKFKGGSSDGDACKSGHLCRAVMNPAMRMADCATAGTAKCSN
jgi:hypothetical protein